MNSVLEDGPKPNRIWSGARERLHRIAPAPREVFVGAPLSDAWDRVQTLGANAIELAPYQDEPPQMNSGAVGKNAFLHMGFERRGARTVMVNVDRRVPFLVQRALHWDIGMPDMACVFVLTTSGGTLQGDRYTMEIDVEAGASAHVTTQSATKIQSMDHNYAAQVQVLRLREGAYLEYIPEPIIPYRGSRFITDTRIEMHPSATLIYSEILVPGRRYHSPDEYFGFDVFSSTITGYTPEGSETYSEKFVLEPRKRPLRQLGVMGAYDIYANVMLLTPKASADAISAKIGADLHPQRQIAYGVSKLPNEAGLVFKILGDEVGPVKEKLREFQAIVREVVKNASLPPQFMWR